MKTRIPSRIDLYLKFKRASNTMRPERFGGSIIASAIVAVVATMAGNQYAFAEFEKLPDPVDHVRQMIQAGNVDGYVKLAETDIDRDGDMDTLMTKPSLSGTGSTSWFIFFKEDGEYYQADDSSIALQGGMAGAGRLEEFDGNWGIVTYSKDSASTGVVHGTWFEKN